MSAYTLELASSPCREVPGTPEAAQALRGDVGRSKRVLYQHV